MSSTNNLNNAQSGKRYGLLLPAKSSGGAQRATSVLGLGTKAASKRLPLKGRATGGVFEQAARSDSDDEEDAGQKAAGDKDERAASKSVNRQLQSVQLQKSLEARKEHAKALEEDPSVFDYDGVYDSLKEVEKMKKKARAGDGDGPVRKPRYIQGLLKAAEERKIEEQRIEDRKIQRERELEGDEFGDKEKFVTGAYKQHQIELKRLEEEERRKAALEEDVTKKSDLSGFYRQFLEETTHDPTRVKLKKTALSSSAAPEGDAALGPSEALPAHVQLNDSGEIVDHRQLLGAGLNVAKKSRTIDEERRLREAEEQKEYMARKQREEEERRREEARRRKAKEEQARRSLAYVMEQAKEKQEEERKRKNVEFEELGRKLARKNDETAVMDARARYLARKKEQSKKKAKPAESDEED